MCVNITSGNESLSSPLPSSIESSTDNKTQEINLTNLEDDYFKIINGLFNIDYQYYQLVVDSYNADNNVLNFHSSYKINKNDDVYYKVDYVNGKYVGIELLSKDGKQLEVIEGERIVIDINLLLIANYYPEINNLDNYTINENRLTGTIKDVSMFYDLFPQIEGSLSIKYNQDFIVSYNLEFNDNGIKTIVSFSNFMLS